jgi:hypothetical protein
LVEGVQFGHGQHIGFGQFTTPAACFWTALSKSIKKMPRWMRAYS